MPSLIPITEGTETLSVLSEGSESLTTLEELANKPALYPSLNTYPSASGTYPSAGIIGLALTTLSEV